MAGGHGGARAYRVYRQPADRTLGVQFLDTLVRRYPSSSLVDDARALTQACPAAALPRQGVAARDGVASQPRPAPAPAPLRPPAPGPCPLPPTAPSAAHRCCRARARGARPSAGRLATLRGLPATTVGDTVRLTLDFDAEVVFDHQRLPGPNRVFFDFARTAPSASLADTVLQFEGPTCGGSASAGADPT